MNTPIFPLATVFLAAAETAGTTPTTLIGVAEKYGPLGLIALAMGAFAVWQENQRRKTQELDRAERIEYLNALLAVIATKDAQIKAKDEWILERADRMRES